MSNVSCSEELKQAFQVILNHITLLALPNLSDILLMQVLW